MRSLEFNVSGTNQSVVVENASHDLNPSDAMTVEAFCSLLGDSEDPTIFSVPAGENWSAPYVAWRLGFHGKERVPEFQVTMEGDVEPTTARSSSAVGQNELVHLAGAFDGSAVRLYVNGKLEAEVLKAGRILSSTQKPTMASRSATDVGGLLIGRLYEVRFWNVARPAAEIENWKDKSLPLPAPDGLVSLWKVEPSLDAERAAELASKGFSLIEIAMASFATAYALAYSELAPELLTGVMKVHFGHNLHAIQIARTSDGYIVLYEPAPPDLLAGIGATTEMVEAGGFFLRDWSEYSLSDILQEVSGNGIKIGTRQEGGIELPKDRDDTIRTAVNPRLKEAKIPLPQIHILREADEKGRRNGRMRITSPLITLPGGATVRAYPWLFADLWFGELTWDIARKGLSDYLAMNDVLGLNQFAAFAQAATPQVIEVKDDKPLLPLEKIIAEFEDLIGRDDVDEVRDVLPFLRKKEHWVLLSPTALHVWPEKMLGNKYRVDFVVRESDGTYTATEIESPKKRLYKTGESADPFAEWTHAEQQVRDYCNFIDANRDYVEREEGLTGVHRPRGLVIIGRRDMLTAEGKKKLAERNADNGRHKTMTFDDLLDQAKTVVERLMALIAPRNA